MSRDQGTVSQEQLNAAISDSVQERGRARAEALKSLGSAFDSPPPALVELVTASGIDLHQVRDGDDAYRMRFAQVVQEAIKRFGEEILEAEYAVAATLDPKHPLSANPCRDLSQQVETLK